MSVFVYTKLDAITLFPERQDVHGISTVAEALAFLPVLNSF